MKRLDLDNTGRSKFSECPRKYYWETVRCLVPKRGRTALRFGSAFHGGIEAYYQNIIENGWSKPDEHQLRLVVKAIGNEFDIASTERESWWDDYRTEENCAKLCADYIDYWFEEDSHSMKPINAELKIGIDVGDINGVEIGLTGKTDLVASLHHRQWGIEHKTTSADIKKAINQQNRSAQVCGYYFALKETGYDIDGFMLNFAYAKSNQSKSKAAIAQVDSGGPKIWCDLHTNFARHPVVFTRSDLAEWKTSFLYTAEQILICYERMIWPMQFDSCHSIYGTCMYDGLCGQQCKPKDAITDDYMFRVWDPRV